MYNYREVKSTFEIEGFYTAIKYDWNEPFVFNGESHDFWEAVFVESGRVDVTEDENFYTLSEGNVIFHAPMEFHRIRSSEGSAPKVFVFSFKASGELPAAIIVDAVGRLVDGVLPDPSCYEDESIFSGLLEYPQYTRPEEYEGKCVPEILLSGHHANIQKWKKEQSIERTKQKRPDLFEKWLETNEK